MIYVAICPACNDSVEGGGVCGCGYLHLDVSGHTYTRINSRAGWKAEPNILVLAEEAAEVIVEKEEESEGGPSPPPPNKRRD